MIRANEPDREVARLGQAALSRIEFASDAHACHGRLVAAIAVGEAAPFPIEMAGTRPAMTRSSGLPILSWLAEAYCPTSANEERIV